MIVQKETLVPTQTDYYDEDGLLERTMYYKEVKKIGTRYVPHKMVMQPQSEDKKENITTVIMSDVNFNPKLDGDRFSKRALTRYSK